MNGQEWFALLAVVMVAFVWVLRDRPPPRNGGNGSTWDEDL